MIQWCMSAVVSDQPLDPKALRARLHETIDSLPDDDLKVMHEQWVKVELNRLFETMAKGAEQDDLEGKLDSASIDKAVKEHRVRHPYR
jgi:hypothetical protein